MANRRDEDDDYVPRMRSEREADGVFRALNPEHEWQPDPFRFPPDAPERLIPFRTPYKLVQVERMGLATPADIFKVYRVPRYMAKKQKRYMYYHVHGYNTWMVDIVFIKTDGSMWDLSEEEATVLAQAEQIRDRYEAPVPVARIPEEEGEGEGEGEGEDEEEEPPLPPPDQEEQFINEADRILEENRCKIVLLCVHCNSRFAQAFVIKDQKALTLIPCLKLLQRKYKCDTVISDAQASIAKAITLINRYALFGHDDRGLKHIKLNMSAGNNKYFHTMLSLVDRMCRTLRDMIYNAKFNNPRLEVDNGLLYRLCEIYNNVQHDRLSEVMGFPITPEQMFKYKSVQEEFVRRASAHNYRIRDINRGLPEGEIVRVRNAPAPFKKRRNTVEDDEYEVLAYDGRYWLRNLTTGNIGRYLRSQIVRY